MVDFVDLWLTLRNLFHVTVLFIHCVSKNLIPSEKKYIYIKVERKYYRISLCFCKVNVVPLILTLIVSIELARYNSSKR